MTTFRNVTGNGDLKENAIATYSYSEDATPLDLVTSSNGAGQVSVNFDYSDGARGSRLLINNELEIIDDYFGTLKFSARKYSEGADGNGSLTGETIGYKLNAYRAAPPHGGAGANLFTAVNTYCALVDVTPVISAELQVRMEAVPVNFIGWTGNVWQYLEMLCQAVSLDTDDNSYLEMAVINNQLHFRAGLQNYLDIADRASTKNLDIESYDAAQYLNMSYYKTEYGSNRIVREQNPTKGVFAINEHVSITDSLQVNAGETLVKRVKINASLNSVNQPQIVSHITTLPFPITGSFGEYVVVGSDDYRVEPTQWEAEGGSLTVRLTDVPDEIELIITAPKSQQILTATGEPAEATLAPYKIGVENGIYPALYISGTGVFFEKQEVTLPTGASSDYAPSINTHTIDNPFIATKNDMLTRATAAAQAICGPRIRYTATVHDSVEFGESIGGIISDYDTKFRVSSISFSESSASIAAQAYCKVSEFTDAWTGATFADFAAENDGLKFNEFTVIPLVRGA